LQLNEPRRPVRIQIYDLNRDGTHKLCADAPVRYGTRTPQEGNTLTIPVDAYQLEGVDPMRIARIIAAGYAKVDSLHSHSEDSPSAT